MGRVDGKVAFITGAGRGMGRSHALRLAEEGADLVLVDVCAPVPPVTYPMSTPEDLEETARLAGALGAKVVARQADVRRVADLRAVVDEGVAELGRLDVVVANAGVLTVGAWDDVTDEDWQTTLDVDLTGVWNTCRVAIPHLLAEGGSVICVSSTAGLKGQPLTLPYTAAKHGVVGLARGLANELAEHRIRVNTIHPTGVATGISVPQLHDLLAGPKAHFSPGFQNAMPVTRIDARDVSNAVLFLASDESAFVTGLEFKVDAGATVR
jgi:SDR family mycofactocin-dependent oxidoreductase